MKNRVKILLAFVFSGLFMCFFLNRKDLQFNNLQFNKNKLTTYFTSINSKNQKLTLKAEKNTFVQDTIVEIKKRSTQVKLVEFSSFTNGISIRCLYKNNVVKNYFFEEKNKHSKHIDSIYISVNKTPNLLNNQFNKILNFIAYDLTNYTNRIQFFKNFIETDDSFNMFYFSKKEITHATLKNNPKFVFDGKGEESLHLVNVLLKNYAPSKFEKLWKNNFTDFSKIYGKSFSAIENEYEKLLSQNIIYHNNYFEECI